MSVDQPNKRASQDDGNVFIVGQEAGFGEADIEGLEGDPLK